jgi:hypothetical protein
MSPVRTPIARSGKAIGEHPVCRQFILPALSPLPTRRGWPTLRFLKGRNYALDNHWRIPITVIICLCQR